LLFEGAGAAAIDTAGKFSRLSPERAAEVATEVAAWEAAAFETGEAAVPAGFPRATVAAWAAFATAGSLSRLARKGIAEPAMVAATGVVAPVVIGEGTDPNSSLLSLKGAVEYAAEVSDCKTSLFCTGSARSAPGAVAAGVALALALAAVAAGDMLGGSVPASVGGPK
jgi:hypothetical protein